MTSTSVSGVSRPAGPWPSLVHLLRQRAEELGRRRAYTFLPDGEGEETHLDYGELDRRARAIGALLADLGAAGERILLLYPAGLDYVAAFFGCLYAAAVAVPVYPPRPNRPMPRVRSIVADSGAAVVLTTGGVLAALAPRLAELPDLARLVWRSTDDLDPGRGEAWRQPQVGPDTLAFLQYTSGSTAAPKGVMVGHGNLLHNERLIRDACRHDADTPFVSWLPLYHDLGLIGNVLQSLYIGAPCALMSPVSFLKRPVRWLEAVSRFRAHTSGGPNFAYELCARKIAPEERRGLDLTSWRVAFNGAEPVRAETLERFTAAFAPHGFDRRAFYPCYGMAETTLIVSGGERDEGPRVERFASAELERHRAQPAAGEEERGSRPLVASGRPLGELSVVIAEPESGRRLGAGEVGEIWVAGPSVCHGYWNRPEETAATFGARLDGGEGPYLRTGDLGFQSAGGLFVTGRLKDLIIIRGNNHYPQDLELTVERSHPALRPGCGAAFAVDDGGEERLVVVQELDREHRDPDIAAIAAAVRRALAEEHEVELAELVLIRQGTLPKTSSGKVQRRRTRAALAAGELAVVGRWSAAAGAAETPAAAPAATTPEELEGWLLARLPAGAAAQRAISECGLDSLRAIELTHQIESELGVVVALDLLFEGVSVAGLAREIHRLRQAAAGAVPVPAEAAAPPPAVAPLSWGQRSLWFLHQLDPASPAYNLATAVRLRGALDVGALRRAFQTLVDRHPALRTTFEAAGGDPVQRIRACAGVAFEADEAVGLSAAELEAEVAREAQRPFDLARGPLLRVRLWSRGGDDHALLLALHHAVADLWSLAVLARELGEAYGAARRGGEASLPPLPAYSADHARWQAELLASAQGERLWRFWEGELGVEELPDLDLPTDRPRPPVQTTRGRSLAVRLDAGEAAAVRALARASHGSPFSVLAGAFQALLHRLSGQPLVAVGAPAAGRSRADFAGVVGFFVNPVVLKADFRGDPAAGAFLAAAARTARAALEHQEAPFAALVERLRPERDPSRSPLFQAMFAWQAAPGPGGDELAAFALGAADVRVRLGELTLEPFPLAQSIAQFDLTLTLGEAPGGGIAGTLDVNRDLFDGSTAARWARSLRVLLAAVAREPERRISELPLLTAGERRQVLGEWNDAPAAGEDLPVHRLFAAQAERTPGAVAVLAAGAALTYRELAVRAGRLARRLGAAGAGPETLVALRLERSGELVAAILGVLAAGAAYLPLDPGDPPERSAYLLGDAAVPLLVAAAGAAPAPPAGVRVLAPAGDEGDAAGGGAPLPAIAVAPAGAACVIYTSGSTGEPKGVVLTHANLSRLVASFVASYAPGAADRILPLTSIASASFTGEVLPLLTRGGAVVLPDREQLLAPGRTFELIADAGVSILSSVPSMVAGLNTMAESLPRLRYLLVGGEALAAGDVDRLLGAATLVNGYGLTETSICSTVHTVVAGDLAGAGTVPIGRPLGGHRLYLLDSRLHLRPAGCPGELFIAGGGVARGYRGRPGLTAARFLPDPFAAGERMYKSGDLARWRGEGALEFVGRSDQQVKIRGFRIELGEVETVLSRHPAVAEAALTVREDVPGQRRLVAYVVGCDGGAPAPELAAFLKARLPDYMVPADFVPLPALPLAPSGKVDLAALPAPERGRGVAAGAYAAPRGELERTLAAIWREALGVERVGVEDNFFDLGGHSLLLARVHRRIEEALGRELSLVDLFKYPTVAALARFLGGEAEAGGESAAARAARQAAARAAVPGAETAIAVVGLAGRFPGAGSPAELWRNLVGGVESIRFFSDDELLAAGIDPELVANPHYVKAKGILGGVDGFDAGLFGVSARGAELMDPQHRVFLECAWEALEDAGHDPGRYGGRIGVFAGQSMNTYWLNNLYGHIDLVASVDSLEAAIGNDKDSLTTEVSYRLDLRGPSVLVQSSSSTSLTAVHYACRSLLAGECDMALAGGVSIHLPEVSGYLFHEGGTTAPDGHCRAFDAAAQGFVSGHGAGVVVLKRLAAALADGDTVHAVIKGSACNNDGSVKVSYMAPSVDGHAEVVAMAQAAAGVGADTVGYVEAHGTGTLLGDPIEVAALTQAFRLATDRRGFCALGALKTNIGHLDTAAGVAGLIKAVLCLENRTLPAALHFTRPNPKIDWAASPFFVNDRLRRWETPPGVPRRAGVSSLGMGGTNTHVVLEEAPAPEPSGPSRPLQLLVLSARTAAALEAATDRLAADLAERGAETRLADVAFTLAGGRKVLPYRRALVAADAADAARALAARDGERLLGGHREAGSRPVAFLFSGQGAQYPGMGEGLYAAEAVFRREVDRAAELLAPHLGCDLRQLLFPPAPGDEEAAARLRDTAYAQPALFTVEHALAQLWMAWGVLPQAMLGHSLGEYVAACLAGVFTLEEALALVAARGRLMAACPPGAMLALPLPEEEVAALLAGELGGRQLAIAAVNRPGTCVVSGPQAAVDELARRLAAEGREGRPLHTSHAFHSPLMEGALEPFRREVGKVRLRPPQVPFLSNLTGTWIRDREATDPDYWVRHLRGAVRFAAGVGELLAEPERVLVEVGPGNALATAAGQHPERRPAHAVVASLRHPRQPADDLQFLLTALARVWLAGVEVDWGAYFGGERRRRVPLPTYPFERQRYWVEPKAAAGRRGRLQPAADLAAWFHAPLWKRSLPAPAAAGSDGPWLVFLDDCGLGAACAARLAAAGRRVVTVARGEGFARLGEGAFVLDPAAGAGYRRLFEELGGPPPRLLHLWSVTRERPDLEAALAGGYTSLMLLGRALSEQRGEEPIRLVVVSNHLQEVTGEEELCPEKAPLLGPCRVLPQEIPRLDCRSLDVAVAPDDLADPALAARVLAEFAAPGPAPVAALRGAHRWVEAFAPAALAADAAPRLRRGGVVLVTGGLGGLGLAVAEHLVRTAGARLVLVGRSALPEPSEWQRWLAEAAADDPMRARVAGLVHLEELGAEVLTAAADVADPAAMARVREAALARFGQVNGIVHAAGVPGGGLVGVWTPEAARPVLAPKLEGTRVLARLFGDQPLDFFALFSSVTATLAPLGQADYAAANAYLDAFARARSARGGPATVAIGWDAWREVGMAARTAVPAELRRHREASLRLGLSPQQGVEAFERILRSPLPQVVVSRQDFAARLEEHWAARGMEQLPATPEAAPGHPRPELPNAYVAPTGDAERRLAAVWEEQLGVAGIGVNDNFFDLGGNSLIGLKVIARIREELGVELPAVSLFESPTVRTLARLVAPGEDGGEAGYEESRDRGARRRARVKRRRGTEAEA
jgi:amino acid adenylation domain-containing protein